MEEDMSVRINEAWENKFPSKIYVTGGDGISELFSPCVDVHDEPRGWVDRDRDIWHKSFLLWIEQRRCMNREVWHIESLRPKQRSKKDETTRKGGRINEGRNYEEMAFSVPCSLCDGTRSTKP